MVKGFKQVGDVEKRLVLNMKKEGVWYMKILKITGRSPDTVTKILYPDKKTKKIYAERRAAEDFPKRVR